MVALTRFALAALAGLPLCFAQTPEWPQWRGPNGEGHAPPSSTPLPVFWSESQNIAWKTPIPGRGWSSPVIAGDQIWMTTALETEASSEDAARRLKTNTGDQPLTLLEKVEFRAVCVDRPTGLIRHNLLLLSEKEPQWVHRLNSYASPTPVLEPGRLYTHFGSSGAVCVDTRSSQIVWTQTNLRVAHENGPGSSPILWQDLLICHFDGSDRQFVAALDKHSGNIVWKTERSGALHSNPQLKKSYATPAIVPINGKQQLVSQGADWLYGYDPATGQESWKMKYGALGFSLSAKAVTGHGRIYLCTGFSRSEILAVRAIGESAPEIVWRYAKGAPTMPSPLLVGDELYFVSDSGGMLTCLDAHTGREHYRERVGGEHSASLLFADGRIHVSNRDGVTAVLAPGKEFKLLAKNKLSGAIMATPAVAGRAFFIRTSEALYRVEDLQTANP